MPFPWKQLENNESPIIRTVRIVLLVLIVVGIGLLVTQDRWVPVVVSFLL